MAAIMGTIKAVSFSQENLKEVTCFKINGCNSASKAFAEWLLYEIKESKLQRKRSPFGLQILQSENQILGPHQ